MGVVEELERIFHPRGVAIVGASNKLGNLGNFYLQGFLQQGFDRDKLYVVHPIEKEVSGVKAYPRVRDIPGDVDLAIVFSPREAVPAIVMDCTYKGITGVAICTSGFGEHSSEGQGLQQELVNIARSSVTRLIGPNCLGIYCPASRLVNYAGVMPVESGPVGMISQSGSLTVQFPLAASGMGIHFSKVVSCGNECDLNAADFLEYFDQDAETQIIVAYIEGVKDGRRFFNLARDISKRKPIIVWKGGTSVVGSRSVASHTGALAGAPQIWDAVFKQTGIINVDSEDMMLDCLQAFYFLPLPRGNRVAIISGAGGTGVTIADACIEYGLAVAELSEATKVKLKKIVPPVGTSIDNPLDLGMMSAFDLNLIAKTVETLAMDEHVDMIVKTVGTNTADYIRKEVEAMIGIGKPVAYITGCAMRVVMEEPKPVKGVAIYPNGRRAAQVLSKMVQYQQYRLAE